MVKRACQLAVILLLVLAAAPLHAASVTVAWDPNPEPDVVAYIVHWGSQSGVYRWNARVTGTERTIDGLEEGNTYYFAIQAVSADGLTSPFSEEVSARISGPTIVSFTCPVRMPGTLGLPITWSATATGGSGDFEYKFFLYSSSTRRWDVLQEWGPDSQVTWTPRQSGVYALQAWIRTVGSTATYQDWKSTGFFAVGGDPQITSFQKQPAGPVRVGYPVTLTATVGGGEAPFEYQFWVYDQATRQWTALGDYGPSNQAQFTPRRIGRYSVQVWVRSAGSTRRYDAWASGGEILATTQVVVQSLTANVEAPVAAGTPITWTALGGGAPNVEYKFWLHSGAGGWTLLRDWETGDEVVWTPDRAGTYQLQVWAREVGSAAEYAAWKGAGPFSVTAADGTLVVYAVNADRRLPVAAGTTLAFEAVAGGGAGPIEYQFWLHDGRSWQILRDYSTSPRATWTPSAPGTYNVQAWARRVGSTERYDAWKSTGAFQVTAVEVSLSSFTADTNFPVAPNTQVLWRAAATASNGAPVEYQFWAQDDADGVWRVVRTWGSDGTATWTPARAGVYHLQVWARVQGSPARYDAWRGTGDIVVR
jgi:hypothetical protein